MFTKNKLALGSAALALIGGVTYLTRQAIIQNATTTEGHEGTIPSICVTLHYGSGTRPWSVIIDVLADNGATGSSTIGSEDDAADIPLSAPLRGPYTVTTTATYRVLGFPRVVTRSFHYFQ